MYIKNSQWDNVIAQIFLRKRNELFNGQDCVRSYIDDLLINSNRSLEDYIKILGKAQNKLKSADF